jgi:hypothetical protein
MATLPIHLYSCAFAVQAWPRKTALHRAHRLLFDAISVKVLPGKSMLFICAAVLGIALTLIVGPFGCALLCADDCCSDDSSCPICLFTGVHGAPANAPLVVVLYISSAISLLTIPEAEFHSADDHQLLPNRAPPALLALVAAS